MDHCCWRTNRVISASGQTLLLQSEDSGLTRAVDHSLSRFSYFGEFGAGKTIFVQVRIAKDYYFASWPLLLVFVEASTIALVSQTFNWVGVYDLQVNLIRQHLHCDHQSEDNRCCQVTTFLPSLESHVCYASFLRCLNRASQLICFHPFHLKVVASF